jgi:hypothetical protein
MSDFELAQLNIAYLKAPIDSPLLADFVANLERINLLAEATEGFRWRLQSDEGDATSLRPFGEDVIVNMSVWRDLASPDATGRAQASEQRSIALTADGVGIVDKSAPALGAFDVSSRAQPGLPIRRLA